MNEGDLLILGLFRSPSEVAYFKLAKSIGLLASLPMMPLVQASYPEFSAAAATRSWDRFRALMRQGSKLSALWFVPVSLGLAAASPFAIDLLYGESFGPAARILPFLLVGIAVDGILFWTRASMLAMGEPGYPTAVYLWTTAAKYAIVVLVVPTGGYIALAAISGAAVVGMNALTARRALTRLRMRELMTDG
jgi:O-antigen/teichoic acid export membrane protein